MSPETRLSRSNPGEGYGISRLDDSSPAAQRLLELGFCPGCVVRPLFSALGGGLTAYLIRNSVIALRHCDAEKIIVRPI